MTYNREHSQHQTWDLLLALNELNRAVYWFTTIDGVGEAQRAWRGFEEALKNLRYELSAQYGLDNEQG